MTTVFQINDNGDIQELATYSLPPQEAIRNAFLQFVKKNFNTWDYHKQKVSIQEGKRGLHIFYGENSSLFTRT